MPMKQVLITSTSVSGATNSNSAKIKYVDHYAIQMIITDATGLSNAAYQLQGSNDDTNWDNIDSATGSITANGNILVNQSNAGYKYVRVRFTIDSGSFTVEGTIVGKERKV